jgi:hypothetical protein
MRAFVLILLLAVAACASAQEKILRFHGYDGTLFLWSGNLTARAPVSDSGWLEPVLDAPEREKWKSVLTNEGYNGLWSNLLEASKELARGKGDVRVKAQLLFKQVPEGARFVAVAPGKVAASASVSVGTDAVQAEGLGGVTSALGGPGIVDYLTQRLRLQRFSGARLWDALGQVAAERPLAVLTPSRGIIWIESLAPNDFAALPIAGRQAAPAPPRAANSNPTGEPETKPAQSTPFPWLPLIGGVVLGGALVMVAFRGAFLRNEPKPAAAPKRSEAEQEYAAATKKLQKILIHVPSADPLGWLRDRAPQQVSELDKSSKIGQYVLKKLRINLTGQDEADQRAIDSTIASLQKTEADLRQDWVALARATSVPDSQTPEQIAQAIQQLLESLRRQVGDHEAFMRKTAASLDGNAAKQDSSPQEALHWAATRLQKRFQETDALAQKLEKDSRVLEALKPGAYLGEQIRLALHGVRPALADREVFAIVGYLLNYSLATLQSATIHGDANLRMAMLHNLRTVSAALAPFEDSFAQICEQLKPMIGATELQPSTEKHSDQSDFLTLLQKALDLRNLRLSPFYIATDPNGRPYSVNTALA